MNPVIITLLTRWLKRMSVEPIIYFMTLKAKGLQPPGFRNLYMNIL
jgi:hypothetical protein